MPLSVVDSRHNIKGKLLLCRCMIILNFRNNSLKIRLILKQFTLILSWILGLFYLFRIKLLWE